ncbi:MAG: hypothetical protein M0005_18205 [Actinomycetota bacterium]|nr:hypothetical protein [Actinomycetota bacterium]
MLTAINNTIRAPTATCFGHGTAGGHRNEVLLRRLAVVVRT